MNKNKEKSFKLIIAGSRTLKDYKLVEKIINDALVNLDKDTIEIISGGAKGVDTLARQYAMKNKLPCKVFEPNWDEYGKSAGYMRNSEMANYGNALIAIWDGKSKGTKHMITEARRNGLKIKVFKFKTKIEAEFIPSDKIVEYLK
jgi:hypothetical protein